MQYELIKKGIENRVNEIIINPDGERFDGELKDLICTYRELKCYIKDDPMYEIKRQLMGIYLLSRTVKQGGKLNEKRQTGRCISL